MAYRKVSKKLQPVLPEPGSTFHIANYQVRLNDVCGVQGAGAADRTADFGAVQRFINDFTDGTGATAALGAAAEAAIDVARGAARGTAGGASYFVVAQHVAGTDNHSTPCWGYSLTVATR